MIKLTLALPADAAKRLIDLLNSDTPEGNEARIVLGVHSARLVENLIDTATAVCDANNGGDNE